MGEVTVGIDIGTTSVKAVAVDDAGQVLSRSRIRNRLNVPSPTRFEHNAGQAWRRNVRRAWREVAVGHEVAAASVVGIVPTLCAVDRRGVPLTPGLLYGDERGQSPAPTEWEGFLRWAAATAPAAAGLWPAQAVANAALLGDGSVGYIDTTAALTAYPVFSGREWDDERVAATGAFRRQMPAVVAGHGPVGEFDATLLGPGGVDAFAEQLVAGADQPGDVLVICGTTLIVWVVGAGLLSAPGLFTVPHSTPGLDLMGGPSDAGGLFIDWVDRLVAGGGDVHDPDAVPVWAPFPRGERVPFHDPHRRADLLDLDLTHGPDAVRRAAREASGFVVRHMIDLSGVEPKRLVATGGGVNDERWIQALADATDLPVDCAEAPEGAARGAAFLARITAGLESDAADAKRWAAVAGRVEPDGDWVEPTAARYRRFRNHVGPPGETPGFGSTDR